MYMHVYQTIYIHYVYTSKRIEKHKRISISCKAEGKKNQTFTSNQYPCVSIRFFLSLDQGFKMNDIYIYFFNIT